MISMCDLAERLNAKEKLDITPEQCLIVLARYIAGGGKPNRLLMPQAWLDRVAVDPATADELARLARSHPKAAM